jgi:trehalose 6-phosphate phosphatase
VNTRPDILAPRSAHALASFAQTRVLLGFDFDGVLAPIARAPEGAHARARTLRLLAAVAARYPCIVVSGRAFDDLAPRLRGVPLRLVAGNFGHEMGRSGRRPPAVVRHWVAALTDSLAGEAGVRIEDKRYSVHYRHAPDRGRARRRSRRAAAALPGARMLSGTLAMSLLPASGPDKGVALQTACRRFSCERAIYVGDDGTDEDAFASAPPDRLLAVRVGGGASAAQYRLARQRDIDALLQRLLVLRSEPRADGPGGGASRG